MPKIKIPTKICRTFFPSTDISDLSREQEDVIAKAVKATIADAVTANLPLGTVKDEYESEFAFHKNISFAQAIDRPIKLLSKQVKEVPSRVCLRLLISAFEKGLHVEYIPAAPNDFGHYLTALGFSHRHHQDLLYNHIHSALSNGQCGIVEGGTGIGKTLAILANANEMATKYKQRSVIATNTIINMHQYVKTHHSLVEAGYVMAPLQMIVGQRSFVSVQRLLSLVETPEFLHYQPEVKAWVANHGRGKDEDDNMPSYQITSIEKVCPNIPPQEIMLKPYDKDDRGMREYEQQFDLEDASSAIVLCTHAMLCVDAKRRVFSQKDEETKTLASSLNEHITSLSQARDEAETDAQRRKLTAEMRLAIQDKDAKVGQHLKDSTVGILPQYHFLIVDEAHLLEQAMSDALSDRLSFKSALREVKALCDEGKIAQGVYTRASSIVSEIISYYDPDQTQTTVTSEYSGLKDAIRRFCATLLNARGFKQCQPVCLNEIKRLHQAIDETGTYQNYLMITYSPLKHYPQAMMGSVNTYSFLSALWNQTTASCCVSATLYFKKYLEYSASHFIDILNIPSKRCATFEPITPQWLRTPITDFWVPSPENVQFIPADSSIKDKTQYAKHLAAWQAKIGEKVIEVHGSAAGGTLVLMTSFTDVEAVAKHIEGDVDALVYADGIQTLAAQKARFIELTKKGRKPVWLALGGAWTGLDVNGTHIGLADNEIATHDNVITDLVIPKIPFGLNMTLAHAIRKRTRYNSGKLEVLDTAIRFKQGLGRLIRLEGQPKNRRIHMLDGRINDDRKQGFYAPMKQLIETYTNVRTF